MRQADGAPAVRSVAMTTGARHRHSSHRARILREPSQPAWWVLPVGRHQGLPFGFGE